MSALKRGCLAVVIVVLLVLFGGFVYFSINPPLSLPETGYLSATTTRELRPAAFGSPRAYRLHVEPSSNVYEQGSELFPPLRIAATVAGEGGAGSTTIEVLPATDQAVVLTVADVPGSATWELDCGSGDAGPCVGDYILVLRPNSTSTGVDGALEVFAEQEFPGHVPTPFLAGIGVDLDAIDLPAADFETDSERHSVTVGPDAPVGLFEVEVETPADAGVAGGTLIVTAERLDPPIAVGPAAPPPVRVAIVDGANRIVADVGAHPGTPSPVAVPPLRGDYRVVAWWQDFADQRYEVSWELRVGSVSETGRPSIDAAALPAPFSTETVTASGEASVGGAAGTNAFELGFNRDTGTPAAPGRLPDVIGVLHTRVELTAYEGSSPLLLGIGAAYGSSYEPRIPAVLRVGDPVELAIDGQLGCEGSRCGAWTGSLSDPTNTESSAPLHAATVRWDSTLVLWPLEPDE